MEPITFIYRPSVDDGGSYNGHKLANYMSKYRLLDKTVCEDRIVYVFGDADPDLGKCSYGPEEPTN